MAASKDSSVSVSLLRDKLQLAEVKDVETDSARFQVEPIDEELSFDKGFFLFVRAVQLLLARNSGVVIVGVAGPSGAGKTQFCKKVLHFLPGSAVLAMDMYNDASQIVDGNFDDPRLPDYDLLLQNIEGLRDGIAVEAPIYDFKKSERTGFRRVEVPKSRVVVIEGIYALSHKVRCLLDLRVSITGGVHFDLIKRVLRDTTRAAQTPEESIQQISETVYPMYKAYIEPDLMEAHLKIVNTFNPFSGFQNPTYKLKSSIKITEEEVCSVLGAYNERKVQETSDIYLLPPQQTAETCQTWLRMRNTSGRYTLIFEETMSDGPFIISPSISFEVSVRILGGLMALGYTIGAMMKRKSTVLSFQDNSCNIVDVKLDNVEGLGEYIQVHGENRGAVASTGKILGLESSYIPQSYIEEVQLQQMIAHFRKDDSDIIRIATDLHHTPTYPQSHAKHSSQLHLHSKQGSNGLNLNVNSNGNGNGLNGQHYVNGHGGHHMNAADVSQLNSHSLSRPLSPSPSSLEGFSSLGIGGIATTLENSSREATTESIRIQSQLDVIRHEAKDIMTAITRIEMSLANNVNGASMNGNVDSMGIQTPMTRANIQLPNNNNNGGGSPGAEQLAYNRVGVGLDGWFAVGVASGSVLLGIVLGTLLTTSLRNR